MSDRDVVAAAHALKIAHLRAEVLGGEHQTAVAQAYTALLDAVGDVDEPEEVATYRAEVAATQASAPTAEGEAPS